MEWHAVADPDRRGKSLKSEAGPSTSCGLGPFGARGFNPGVTAQRVSSWAPTIRSVLPIDSVGQLERGSLMSVG